MRGILRAIVITVFAITFSAAPAFAKTTTYTAVLNGGQESPAVLTTGLGVAFLTYDTVTDTLTYAITYFGLVAGETAAHIHGPALPGVNAAVVAPLPPGFSKSGSLAMFSAAADDNLKNLKKGLLYINIHSTVFPGGEIRGQILPSSK